MRILADRTPAAPERLCLLHLCSRGAGADDYLTHVRGRHLGLLDLLLSLPEIRPRLTDLVEHLPRLQPRPYSLASDVALDEESVDGKRRKNADFLFNVVDFPSDGGRWRRFPRRGVCTGWLEDAVRNGETGKKVSGHVVQTNQVERRFCVFSRHPDFGVRSSQHRVPPSSLAASFLDHGRPRHRSGALQGVPAAEEEDDRG